MEVAGGEAEIGPEPLRVFLGLTDKSLVNVQMSGSEVRYRLLQMTRNFALAQMEAEEAREARQRHAQHQAAATHRGGRPLQAMSSGRPASSSTPA